MTIFEQIGIEYEEREVGFLYPVPEYDEEEAVDGTGRYSICK